MFYKNKKYWKCLKEDSGWVFEKKDDGYNYINLVIIMIVTISINVYELVLHF